MGDALFTIVREDTLDTSEGLNYDADSVTALSHDEIQLVDDLGDPCAVPVQQGVTSLDVRHDYADGSSADTPIALKHTISLACDWIDNKTRRRLHDLQQDRARVLFTPGFGRHTQLAWRPLETTSTTIPDLTGIWTFDIDGDARDAVWDDINGLDVMRSDFDGDQRIIATPAGAGQVFERAHLNISDPDSPESGDYGWTAGGAGSATLYTSYPHAFGFDDCLHGVRFLGTSTTSARYISYTLPTAANNGPTGEGTINIGLFVRGRFPTDAVLALYNNAALINSVDLDGDYSSWTRIDLQADALAFSDGNVELLINMPGTADAQTCDFYVAARMITWEASVSRYSQAYPQWQTEGATRTIDALTTDLACQYPQTGTLHTSFYVPEWYEEQKSGLMGLVAHDASSGYAGGLIFIAYDSVPNNRLLFYLTDTLYVVATCSPVAGQINTACVTWDHSEAHLYLNGTQVGERVTAGFWEKNFPSEEFVIGYNRQHARGSWPCVMNTVRLEREVWNADRVANEYKTLTDPVALDTIVAARGRTYMIRSIPSQPATVAGKAYWRGPLVLEQVDYDSALADLTSKE